MQIGERKKMPVERVGKTRRFSVPYKHKDGTVDRMKMYITPNLYEDGALGEVFLKVDKVGSLASGVLDALGICISLGLQYGVPLEAFVSKLKGTRFDPSGFTGDQEFPRCTSVLDLLARYLEARFLPKGTSDAEQPAENTPPG